MVKGYLAYLVYVHDTSIDTPTLESVYVVHEFSNVFSTDCLVLQPSVVLMLSQALGPFLYHCTALLHLS